MLAPVTNSGTINIVQRDNYNLDCRHSLLAACQEVINVTSIFGDITILGNENHPLNIGNLSAKGVICVSNIKQESDKRIESTFGSIEAVDSQLGKNITARENIKLINTQHPVDGLIASINGSVEAVVSTLGKNITARENVKLLNTQQPVDGVVASTNGNIEAEGCQLGMTLQASENITLINTQQPVDGLVKSTFGSVSVKDKSRVGHIRAREDITVDSQSMRQTASSMFGNIYDAGQSQALSFSENPRTPPNAQLPHYDSPPPYSENDPYPQGSDTSLPQPGLRTEYSTQGSGIGKIGETGKIGGINPIDPINSINGIRVISAMDGVATHSILAESSTYSSSEATNTYSVNPDIRAQAVGKTPISNLSGIKIEGSNVYLSRGFEMFEMRVTPDNLKDLLELANEQGINMFRSNPPPQFFIDGKRVF